MNLLYVGIDPSISNTGVVVLDENQEVIKIYEPSQEQAIKHDPSFKHVVRRYQLLSLAVVSELEALVRNHRACSEVVICYEDYSYESVNKAFTIGEFGGVLKTSLFYSAYLDVKMCLIPPTTLKLFATGYGLSTKENMLEYFLKIFPTGKEWSNDAVDAFFLAEMAGYMEGMFPANEKKRTSLTRHKLEIAKKCKETCQIITD